MRLSFLPGSLVLFNEGAEFVISVEDEEIFRSRNEKAALRKFHTIRRDMEEKYPATELTREQKLAALTRLIGDSVLREVRNSTRKSKFDNAIKQKRFENR